MGTSTSTRRAIVLVADACGVGALPDAADYGDAGTNTLAHLADAVGGLRVPTLAKLGLGSIVDIAGVAPAAEPSVHGRLHPLGPGKDSITGHWELMGVVLPRALPTYPRGFPEDLIARIVAATGHDVICNAPRNGVAAIDEFGAEHLRSRALILYTSQDSVLQLAAHVDVLPPQLLYEACARAREVLSGEHAVGRVIARPFEGRVGAFSRTDGRRDLTLAPPARSYLQELDDAGVPVHGVGKIGDLFARVGVTHSHRGADNARALASVDDLLASLDCGLVLANLIETDQMFGHRKDVDGFARALSALDQWLSRALSRLRDQDMLIVTADHGVDPAHPGTDHTREYAPLLAVTGAMWRGRSGAGVRERVAGVDEGVVGVGGGVAGAGGGTVGAGGGVAGVREEWLRARARGRAHAREPGRTRSGADGGARRHDGPLADVGATVLRWLTGRDAAALPGDALSERLLATLAAP